MQNSNEQRMEKSESIDVQSNYPPNQNYPPLKEDPPGYQSSVVQKNDSNFDLENVKVFDFDDETIRRKFIRKVFTLLAVNCYYFKNIISTQYSYTVYHSDAIDDHICYCVSNSPSKRIKKVYVGKFVDFLFRNYRFDHGIVNVSFQRTLSPHLSIQYDTFMHNYSL